MDIKKKYTFLARNITQIIYFIFLISFVLNLVLAILYLRMGFWVVGILTPLSAVIIPKAALGIILILGRSNSLVWLNLSEIITQVFKNTWQRYNRSNLIRFSEIRNAIIREMLWLIIGLLPIIIFVILVLAR